MLEKRLSVLADFSGAFRMAIDKIGIRYYNLKCML